MIGVLLLAIVAILLGGVMLTGIGAFLGVGLSGLSARYAKKALANAPAILDETFAGPIATYKVNDESLPLRDGDDRRYRAGLQADRAATADREREHAGVREGLVSRPAIANNDECAWLGLVVLHESVPLGGGLVVDDLSLPPAVGFRVHLVSQRVPLGAGLIFQLGEREGGNQAPLIPLRATVVEDAYWEVVAPGGPQDTDYSGSLSEPCDKGPIGTSGTSVDALAMACSSTST